MASAKRSGELANESRSARKTQLFAAPLTASAIDEIMAARMNQERFAKIIALSLQQIRGLNNEGWALGMAVGTLVHLSWYTHVGHMVDAYQRKKEIFVEGIHFKEWVKSIVQNL